VCDTSSPLVQQMEHERGGGDETYVRSAWIESPCMHLDRRRRANFPVTDDDDEENTFCWLSFVDRESLCVMSISLGSIPLHP
jgi:hypothetical protein